ncbi:MAG: methylmalonyl-CoA epimerase [bacterium]
MSDNSPLKIDHIGIAVEDIESKKKLYAEVMGLEYKGEETIEDQGVRVAFFRIGETNIELLEPLGEDTPVGKFLQKRGEGIHHIALAVKGIEQVIDSYRSDGVRMIDEKPRIGAHGKRIAFLHPSATGGVLLEICEE